MELPEILPTKMVLRGGEHDGSIGYELHDMPIAKYLSRKNKNKLVVYRRGELLDNGLRAYNYQGLEDW